MKTVRTLLLSALLAACGGDPAQPDAGPSDAIDAQTATPDGGDPSVDAGTQGEDDAGPPDAGTACSCDDAIDCTADRCTPEGCVHEPDHNRCEPGSFCGAGGCAPGGVCTSDADCPSDEDACTTRMRCDLALRQCTWERLDGDGDGHAPLVCRGGDCADATPEVSPDATEACNGVDDDCDGVIDGPSADAACGAGLMCVGGECVCPAGETFCGEALGCRVVTGDPLACGTCETACTRAGELCDAGTCVCPAGTSACSDACADVSTSTAHCGACENACAPGAVCTDGACACPAGTSECGVGCVALATDVAHCGACDRRCLDGASCAAGGCSASVGFLRGFQSTAIGAGHRLSVAGMLAHPSGELTLLLSFEDTLDELPFHAISGAEGYYLTRRSSTGEELWSRVFPSENNGTLELIGHPSREGFAIAGNLNGSIDFGDGTVTGSWRGTLVIASYGATGTLTWTRVVGPLDTSSSAPQYVEAAMHDDGSVAVAASLNDPANFGGATLGSGACCTRWAVARYAAADGAHIASWELPTVGSNGVQAALLAAGPAGAVVVAGSYSGGAAVFGATVLPGPNGTFVATYGATGSLTAVFATTGSGFSFSGGSLAVGSDGDIYLAKSDARLARYAPDGTVRWTIPRDATAPSTAGTSELRIAANGDVLVHGVQRGHFDFGGGPFASDTSAYAAVYESDGSLVQAYGLPQDADRSTTAITDFVRAASGTWMLAGTFTERMAIQDRALATTAPSSSSSTPRGAWFAGITP